MIRIGIGAALLAAALASMPSLTAQQALLPSDWERPVEAPALAVGADGTVVATFVVGDEIWSVVSRDEGKSFAAPVRVGARQRLAAGLTRGPRVAVTPDAIVVTSVHGEKLRGRDGDLYAWRSTDRGRTWTGPVRVNDVVGTPREGMHAMAAASDGRLVTVWLDQDGRAMRLSGAWSDDGGASWSQDQLIYASPGGSICQCCVPAVTFEPDGEHAVAMWRNSLEGNRDMYALVIGPEDGQAPAGARRLGSEHWQLDGCPNTTSGVAVTGQDSMLTIWRRGATLYTASPGAAEVELGAGREAAAAAGPDGVHLLWTDEHGMVSTALATDDSGGLAKRSFGRGYGVVVAGAPDALGPVLALWQSREQGPEAFTFVRLADRRAARSAVKSGAGPSSDSSDADEEQG